MPDKTLRACRGCGASIEHRHAAARYCSTPCRTRAHSRTHRRRERDRRRASSYCKHCARSFVGSHKQVYCSTDCQYEARSRAYRGVRPGDRARLPLCPPFRAYSADEGDYCRALAHDICAYCGGRAEVKDHIVPRSGGGPNHWENYTAACSMCNGRKGQRSLLAFLGWRMVTSELERLQVEQAGWGHTPDRNPQ
jgi:hypothetical protein